jgi:hypothetical protein
MVGEKVPIPSIPSSSMDGYLATLEVKLVTWVPMIEPQAFTLKLDSFEIQQWPITIESSYAFPKEPMYLGLC